MYNLREFRAKTKEAFDLAEKEEVLISRNTDVYTLRISVKGSFSPRRSTKKPKQPKLPYKEQIKRVQGTFTVEVCEHSAAKGFCRYAKCKNSMFRKTL